MRPAHLPPQPTTFIGRDRELSEIAELLADPACRLLTVVGPGGIGKTRLAIQAAAGQEPRFANGVSFVALATVSSPDFLPVAIGEALEIPFYGPQEPLAQIMSFLHDQHRLLVMDNFEHLLAGVGCLSDLLAAAPGLKILATSRERLNLREEWVFVLDGLTYPPEPLLGSAESYSAVQLFVQRARQVQHHFSLDDQLQSVLSICRQVEGLPLALELASSWLRVMSCQQIAAHMAGNLDFLTTPLRNVPDRHRSLRLVFEQSWKLLSAAEQAVLMRLALFHGGFDFEAAAQVAGATPALLAGLADKSLLRVDTRGRCSLHELLRQYAEDKLVAAGEIGAATQRHLAYFMKLAEEGEAHAYGREQVTWVDRLEVELDNLRTALAWSVSTEEVEIGLRIAAALRWVWELRGHIQEGLGWFNKLLPISADAAPSVRIKALLRASELAAQLAAAAQAAAWAQEALHLSRQTNDRWNLAWSLSTAAFFTEKNLDQAVAMLEESLVLFRELNDPFGLSHTLRRLAGCAIDQRNYPYAASLLAQALAGDRQTGDKNAIAWELCFMGVAVWGRDHHPEQVIPLYQESISLFQEMHDVRGAAHPLAMLADVERSQGNFVRSQALFQEILLTERGLGICDDLAIFALAGISSLAAAHGHPLRAAEMLGAVHAALASGAYNIRFPPLVDVVEPTTAAVRAQLGEEAFITAWTAGKSLPLEQAIIYALQDEPTIVVMPDILSRKETNGPPLEPLSPREFDVLRLLGAGLSNAEIAKKLFISIATVKVHTRSIYAKLNLSNRTQAILQAQKSNLL